MLANMKKCQITMRRIFGELNITWPKLILFSIIMAIYTALTAMLAPDGNSLHDIAVTMEWWVLPAIIIIVNSKKPLESALKTFTFFLISQPLIYLIQVPFSELHWDILKFYPYWFSITLLTFPGAFIAWYIKKDKWYSGIILSVMAVLLAITGCIYVEELIDNFPNHLISIIYCFAMILVFILVIFKNKAPRIIITAVSLASIIIYIPLSQEKIYEAYNNSFIEENDIKLVGKPQIVDCNDDCKVDIIEYDGNYNFHITGKKAKKYTFSIVDDENKYNFVYYYDKDRQTVIIEPNR